VELAFMNDRSDQLIAPSGLFEGANPLAANGNYDVNCSNPLLSPQQAAILCTPAQIAADAADPGSVSANVSIGRRNVEGGGRAAYFEHTNYRAAGGFTGELGKTLSYDVYAQYYYTQFFNSNDQYLNFQSIGNALQVTGTAANPKCISGGACVPYNIFREGGVTPDQLEYLYFRGTAYGTTTQRTLHADATAELGDYHLQSPLASTGLAVNLGFEHRSEEVVFRPDSGEISGLLSGFGGASVAIDNGYSVDEEFIELRAPLVDQRPGINDLVFDTGFRRSDYDTVGVVNTRKFELQYSPVQDLRFRGSYQHAIRAPSIVELFNPQLVGQITFDSDPCAPTLSSAGVLSPAAATLEQCLRTGVTAAQYGNGGTTNTIPQGTASQLSQLQGGNPDLRAETGISYTFGVNFTPTFLPGLSGSADYYRIRLKDGVGTIPAQIIMTNCLNTGDAAYCDQLVRASNGGLQGASLQSGGYIVQTNLNVSTTEVSGVDLQGTYRAPPLGRWGSLTFSLNGTWLDSVKTTPLPNAHTYDCVGLFGPACGRVSPRWRHTLRASWQTPLDVVVSANWRFIGSTRLDNNDSDETLHNSTFPGFDSFNARLPSVSYLDLSARWTIWRGIDIRGGINNLFDKDPPIVTSELIAGGAANSYELYDGLGRQLFLAMTAKF
jgi:outer membrane receptor protein involved in Fe transport